MKKRIPIGVDDYKDLIDQNCYYVDKTRTAKEGIFPGLNNLSVHDMLSGQFADKFGFTQEEVERFLEDQGLLQHKEVFKQWYNGYTFGSRDDIYNPWSVLECAKNEGRLDTYWANTSENKTIKTLLAAAPVPVKISLELLLQKHESEFKEIVQGVVFPDVQTSGEDALWSFLVFSGYLTIGVSKQEDDGGWVHSLRIPNKEVSRLYKKLLKDSAHQLVPNKVPMLLEAVVTGKQKMVQDILGDFILNSMSFFDVPQKEIERSYHLFILGLLVGLEGRYVVQSNRESGLGRYNVMLIPLNPGKDAGIVIELKSFAYSDCDTIEQAAQNALSQINEKQYAVQLRAAGCKTIYHYGIAFEGKRMALLLERAIS